MKVHEILNEASYPGNIGMMEVAKFYNIATEKQKKQFKELLFQKLTRAAWELIYSVIGGPRLKGREFETNQPT